MRRISALILDLGGVITYKQRKDKVEEMMALLGLDGDAVAFGAVYAAHRHEYDRGSIGAAEYWRRIGDELGVSLRDKRAPGPGNDPGDPSRAEKERITRLVELDMESWFNIRPEMVAFMRRARPRVGRLGLLSNINEEGAAYVGSSYDWIDLFDATVFSCVHKMMKPEREIYELAASSLRADPRDCLFVDDSEPNVDGARRAGMAALRFSTPEALEAAIESEFELLR
jgi:putative hydrolase of the HAD superfamily